MVAEFLKSDNDFTDADEKILDGVDLTNVVVQETEVLTTDGCEVAPTEPSMDSKDWSDFALSKFEEDEMIDGNPTVDGLRRVARLLLGDIIESSSRSIQAPNPNNGYSATVEHKIVIQLTRDVITAREIVFTEIADVTTENTDPEFRRFASSTASTRAEARALRKALMLKRVVAAEEITEVPPIENYDEKINSHQINFIDNICRRTKINVIKYVNSGAMRYEKIEDIPYGTAQKMLGVLSSYQRDPSKIPNDIKGYIDGWRTA